MSCLCTFRVLSYHAIALQKMINVSFNNVLLHATQQNLRVLKIRLFISNLLHPPGLCRLSYKGCNNFYVEKSVTFLCDFIWQNGNKKSMRFILYFSTRP